MRTPCDCMVCCFAMLMNWSYKQASDYFPPKAVKETGYQWAWIIPYISANRIYLVWYGQELLKEVDWSKPAMVDVPSLTAPEKGDHNERTHCRRGAACCLDIKKKQGKSQNGSKRPG